MANVSAWFTTANGNNIPGPPDYPQEGMQRDAVNDTMRENMAALARWYQDTRGGLVTTGTATAYTLTTNSNNQTLSAQSMLSFRVHVTNTGAATLNVDTLGARPLRTPLNQELPPGALLLNSTATVVYNSALDVYVVVSAGALEAAGVPVPLLLTDADDLDTLTAGPRVQFYRWSTGSSPANAPEANAATMAAYSALNGYQTQVVFTRSANREFRRTYNGSWTAWAQILDDGRLASQAQAEAGTDNTTWMSPLGTAQAISALAGQWQLIASNTSLSGSSVSFTNLGGHRDFMLVGRAIASTLQTRRRIQVSVNNGSSWINSGYETQTAGSREDIVASDSTIVSRSFVIQILGADATLNRPVVCHLPNSRADDDKIVTEITSVTSAITAIRIMTDTGAFDGGAFRIYGR